jgi:hypothetical protein
MFFKEGDIVLFGGSSGLMGKLVRYFDNAEYTHIGICISISQEIFILDMWSKGIEIVPIEKRLDVYPKQLIIRPKDVHIIPFAIKSMLWYWQGNRHIGYDYFLLLRIAIAKKLGLDFLFIGKEHRFICSELVQKYANYFCTDWEDISLITPQDFVRKQSSKFLYL